MFKEVERPPACDLTAAQQHRRACWKSRAASPQAPHMPSPEPLDCRALNAALGIGVESRVWGYLVLCGGTVLCTVAWDTQN